MCGVFLAKASERVSEKVSESGKWKKIRSEWKSFLMDAKESADGEWKPGGENFFDKFSSCENIL